MKKEIFDRLGTFLSELRNLTDEEIVLRFGGLSLLETLTEAEALYLEETQEMRPLWERVDEFFDALSHGFPEVRKGLTYRSAIESINSWIEDLS